MVKPLPTLAQMPWHIMQRIVDSTDAMSRFSLRKCSRRMRSIVDNSSVKYQRVSFVLSEDGSISLELVPDEGQLFNHSRKITISYHPHSEGCVIRYGDWEKLFEGDDPMTMAVSDFSTIYINPKVRVRDLAIRSQCEYRVEPPQEVIENAAVLASNIQNRLSKLNRKPNIEHLLSRIPTSVDVLMNLLSCFNTETFTRLAVRLRKGHGDTSALTSSEHWKKAKTLSYTADSFPRINEMAHFEALTFFVKCVLTVEDVKMFVKMAMDLGEKFAYIACSGVEHEDPAALHRYLSQYPRRKRNKYLIERPHSNIVIDVDDDEVGFYIWGWE